jgi:uncharacterized SAM-binding protein YcdF (DUF218 family)
MIYLHKILPFFVLPLGLCFILVLAGIVFSRRYLCMAGVLLLWIFAMPITSGWLMRAVEGWADRLPVHTMPKADAIVVLSGGRVLAPGESAVSEWKDADRFFGGLALYQAGKAPLLIFTGGWAPWNPMAEPEGQVLIRYAREFGIPPENLLTTGRVVSTAEEAIAIAGLLGKKEGVGVPTRVLLVTSAFHMRRSVLLFERSGLEVIPFPVDFKVSAKRKLTFLDLMPQAGALRQIETALLEVYGFCYYFLARAT